MTFLWNAIPTYLFNRPYHYLSYISLEIAICCIFMLGQKGQIFSKATLSLEELELIHISKWILLTKHFKLRSEKLHFCKCWKSVTSTEQMNHSVSWKSNLQLLNCWTTLIDILHHSFKKRLSIHGVKRRAKRSYFLWKYFLKLPSHGYIPAVWNLWSDLNFVAVCTQLVLDDLRNTP